MHSTLLVFIYTLTKRKLLEYTKYRKGPNKTTIYLELSAWKHSPYWQIINLQTPTKSHLFKSDFII